MRPKDRFKSRMTYAGLIFGLMFAVNTYFFFFMTYFYGDITVLFVQEYVSLSFYDGLFCGGITNYLNENFSAGLSFNSGPIEAILMVVFIAGTLFSLISCIRCLRVSSPHEGEQEQKAIAQYKQVFDVSLTGVTLALFTVPLLWSAALLYIRKAMEAAFAYYTGGIAVSNLFTIKSDAFLLLIINSALILAAYLVIKTCNLDSEAVRTEKTSRIWERPRVTVQSPEEMGIITREKLYEVCDAKEKLEKWNMALALLATIPVECLSLVIYFTRGTDGFGFLGIAILLSAIVWQILAALDYTNRGDGGYPIPCVVCGIIFALLNIIQMANTLSMWGLAFGLVASFSIALALAVRKVRGAYELIHQKYIEQCERKKAEEKRLAAEKILEEKRLYVEQKALEEQKAQEEKKAAEQLLEEKRLYAKKKLLEEQRSQEADRNASVATKVKVTAVKRQVIRKKHK